MRHVAEGAVGTQDQLAVWDAAHQLRVHWRGVFDFDVVVVGEHAGRRHIEGLVQQGGKRIRFVNGASFTCAI